MDLVKTAMARRGQNMMGATASGFNSGSPNSSSGEGPSSNENAAYLDAHPEIRAALNDFVGALLLEKPEVREGEGEWWFCVYVCVVWCCMSYDGAPTQTACACLSLSLAV
jgi:hypothetical protein